MPSDLVDHWKRMDELLRRIFAANEGSVSPEAAKWFWEFLENAEFGLAFELLVAALEKSGKSVSSDTFADIEEAGLAMKVKGTWKDLRRA